MKKIKLLACCLLVTSLFLTGCASSFQEAIGNVTQESLKRNSYLTYNDLSISKKLGDFVLYLAQMNHEKEAYITNTENFSKEAIWTEDAKAQTKTTIISMLKERLALLSKAKELGITISDTDKKKNEVEVKTQLGNKYLNIPVEYMADKGILLDEDLLTQWIELNQISQQVYTKMYENATEVSDIKQAIKYQDIQIKVINDDAATANETAQKVKAEFDKATDVNTLASNYNSQVIENIEIDGVKSTLLSDEVQKNVLAMEVGDIAVFEEKNNDKVVLYHVIKITDKNSESLLNEAAAKNTQVSKQEQVNAEIQKIVKEIYVNEDLLNSFEFDLNKKFWDDRKESLLLN